VVVLSRVADDTSSGVQNSLTIHVMSLCDVCICEVQFNALTLLVW